MHLTVQTTVWTVECTSRAAAAERDLEGTEGRRELRETRYTAQILQTCECGEELWRMSVILSKRLCDVEGFALLCVLLSGVRGFYRGFLASLILCSNPAITNACFDRLK